MNCEIIWNGLTLAEWQSRFEQLTRSNLLQSYTYAQAMAKTKGQKARWGLILIDGQEAGLVQIGEIGILRNLFHALLLDRGPLWFDGFGGAAHIQSFFKVFNQQFPKRFGRKRRIMPEIEMGSAAHEMLKQAGLCLLEHQQSYQTLWWDLTVGEETARHHLKSNWRGSLKKAEASGLATEWDDKGLYYPWLREIYRVDRIQRGYGGASPKLLDNLAFFSTQQNPMIIGKAVKDGQDIAAVMFFKHGRSATYQVGWSSEAGRVNCAHHLLLWQARSVLQNYGVMEIDLGGVNDEDAAGIKKFKEGTNAKLSTLVGHYC